MSKLCGLRFIAVVAASALFCMLGASPQASAATQSQEWEIIIPAGDVIQTTIKPAPRITDLAGKTVALRWNGKHNGDKILNYLAERLGKQFPTAKIVKSYEMDTSLNTNSGSQAVSERITDFLIALKPDIVIASQAD